MSQSIWFMSKAFKNDGIFNEYGSAAIINALYRYEGLPKFDDYSHAPAKVRNQCLGIVKVANALLDYAEKESRPFRDESLSPAEEWITDDRLVKFLLADPKNANRVIKVIKEYKRGDFGFIEAKLNGGNVTLSSGAI
jgi:hypothetical protein